MADGTKKKKHRKHNKNADYSGNKLHEEKFGFIEIENPEYYDNNYTYSVPEFLLRKPTPDERKEIIVNYIIAHNGNHIDMGALASELCISYRLMQMILKSLREDGIIEIIHTYTASGKQCRNRYKYIGAPCDKYGSGLTLDMLYDTKNKAGFRSWDWEDFKFKKNGFWYDIDGLLNCKSECRELRRNYLKRANIDETNVIKNIKYFVLRYCYWVGDKDDLPVPPRQRIYLGVDGEYHSDGYSTDGTKRFELATLNRISVFTLFGVLFAAEYNEVKENPEIHFFDPRTNENYITFTYWGENCLQISWDADNDKIKYLELIGEYTSK